MLTSLPDANGAFSEPTDSGYVRVRIDGDDGWVSRITELPFMKSAYDGDAVEIGEDVKDVAIPAVVTNDSLIMFPEIMEETIIVGFGLFRSDDT